MSRTGLVEYYTDKNGNGARRFWVHDRILCGGSIISPPDYEHLKRDFGITGVMNYANDIEDHATIECGIRLPFPDDGGKIPKDLIHDSLDWAKVHLASPRTVLYVHCALGGSRGPSMAYAVARGVLRMSKEQVMEAISVGHPVFAGWAQHWNPKQYLADIEEALLTWPG